MRTKNKGLYRYGQWIYEVRVRRRWKRQVIRRPGARLVAWWDRSGESPVTLIGRKWPGGEEGAGEPVIVDLSQAEVIQQHTWVSMGGPMVKVE